MSGRHADAPLGTHHSEESSERTQRLCLPIESFSWVSIRSLCSAKGTELSGRHALQERPGHLVSPFSRRDLATGGGDEMYVQLCPASWTSKTSPPLPSVPPLAQPR